VGNRVIALGTCLYLAIPWVSAQQKIRVQQHATNTLRQSLYDIRLINDSTCYAVGELGARALVHLKGTITVTQWQDSNASTIVELLNTTNAEAPLVESEATTVQYCNFQHNDTIYSAHFNKHILAPKRVIPRGKLCISSKTGNDTRRFFGSCIWQFFEKENRIYFLKYNLLGTKIICANDKKTPFKRLPFLLHKSYTTSQQNVFCGAKNFKLKDGIIIQNTQWYKLPDKGMVWDVAIVGNTIIAAGSRGCIHYKKLVDDAFTTLQTPSQFHFYDIAVVSDSRCVLVGQSGEVYSVDVLEQ
jgi:hypothetical protein